MSVHRRRRGRPAVGESRGFGAARLGAVRRGFAGLGVVASLVAGPWACVSPSLGDPEPPPRPIAVGETRQVELAFLRFDVRGFEETFTREDLLRLPEATRKRLWLLDLDLSNSPSSPHLMDNALLAVEDLDPSELSPPARNMQRLLRMTPDTADLRGTSFEELADLAPLIGIAPARALADMMDREVDEVFLPRELVSATLLDLVVETHPAARRRAGPVTPQHPDGWYPVAPDSIPISLDDVLQDFRTLSERFGEWTADGEYHPGFVAGASSARVLGDDFRMVLRANANALPYKGVDLGDGSVASVNSIASQIERLFDFDDPRWLVIEGLIEGVPSIDALTFRIVEWDGFVQGGDLPVPAGQGSSAVWTLPPWTFEHLIAEASRRAFGDLRSDVAYTLPGREAPVFEVEVRDGWAAARTDGDLGNPPSPAFVWDLLLEIAQVRLHDGGIDEGAADVEVTLRDVPVGIDNRTLEATIRENLRADPSALVEVAGTLIDATEGEADFYYYRPEPTNPPDVQGDWLVFIAPQDIPTGPDGRPVRPWSYARPGFWEDSALTRKASAVVPLDGDTVREKVRVSVGDVVYVSDVTGAVFEVRVTGKPSQARIALDVRRVQ